MPRPANGLAAAAASPTTSHDGPPAGVTDNPTGSRTPRSGAIGSTPNSQSTRADSTTASSTRVVFTESTSRAVESTETPTLTEPSPAGTTHAWPGRSSPDIRRRSSRISSVLRCDCPDGQRPMIVSNDGHDRSRTVPSERPNVLVAPSAATTTSAAISASTSRSVNTPRTTPRSTNGRSASTPS